MGVLLLLTAPTPHVCCRCGVFSDEAHLFEGLYFIEYKDNQEAWELCNYCDTQLTRLENDGWIPCTEALPDGIETVLISNPCWREIPVWMGYYDGEEWRCVENFILDSDGDDDDCAPPTHWQPLPPPAPRIAQRRSRQQKEGN